MNCDKDFKVDKNPHVGDELEEKRLSDHSTSLRVVLSNAEGRKACLPAGRRAVFPKRAGEQFFG